MLCLHIPLRDDLPCRDTLRREAASKYPQEAAAYKDLQEQKTAEPSNAV